MSDRIAVMNRGRYEQLGEPEELYERPKTRFVAGFLGISNLLPTRLDGTVDGYAVCRLADDTALRVPAAMLSGAASPEIGIRPEKVRLFEVGDSVPAAMNTARGVVRDASYLGVSTQYIVDLKGGEKVTVYEQNSDRAARESLFQRGEEAIVAWSPEHAFVVADAASTGYEEEPSAV